MPVRRRSDKRRDALTDDEINWLEGRPSFTAFKDDDFLADLWARHGDTGIATWEEGSWCPRAV